MSLPTSHQSVIDNLTRELLNERPSDVIQHCANYFHRLLATERSSHLSEKSGGQAKNKMTDTGGPFSNSNPFGANSIQEEEEEDKDTFASPREAARDTGSSPFGNSSPFGAAAGSATGGGLFGSWMSTHHGGAPQEGVNSGAEALPTNYAAGGRRTSVSAESMQPDADSGHWKPPKHHKTQDQYDRLKTAVAHNFLFSHLDEDSFQTVLDALVEKSVPAQNIKVIQQGDEGDYFYVIESGDFDIYINSAGSLQSGADGMGNKVASIGPGNSFGELALMYNAPRAATVVSASKGGLLWALDRVTFRRILMDSASSRRKMYEGFLGDVQLLASLKPYERAKIADALETIKYNAGDHIIREGEPGESFYLLESGEAAAYKGGDSTPVKEYTRGDFFGELALLDNKPRAASVVAKTDVKVAMLGRDGFKRLLGPVESIMRREEYGENVDPLSKKTAAT